MVERRAHVAGNAYDEINQSGILVHRCGPHIFHTNSDCGMEVSLEFHRVAFVRASCAWFDPRQARPDSFQSRQPCGSLSRACCSQIESALVGEYGFGKKVPILKLRESNDPEIRDFAELRLSEMCFRDTRSSNGNCGRRS